MNCFVGRIRALLWLPWDPSAMLAPSRFLPLGQASVPCGSIAHSGRPSLADCSEPHATTKVKAASLDECLAECEVFALEGRCKFVIFDRRTNYWRKLHHHE